MLTYRGRPIFPSEGPLPRRSDPLPWGECIATIITLSLIGWVLVLIWLTGFTSRLV